MEPTSKAQINKLGKKIKKELKSNESVSDEALEKLQEYRESFKSDISEVFNELSEISKRIRKDRIVSFRIKRIESILSKLKREPTMALGNMGDIAGCRCILSTDTAVKNLAVEINKSFPVKKENDYLAQPKKDGYRGFHLYVECPSDNKKLIEIQLRSLDVHNWASLVEIIDVSYNQKIKEGEIENDFSRFLLLLSKNKSISINEMEEIVRLDKKKNIYKTLNEIFINNYFPIKKSWIELDESNPNKYFILEVDEEKKSNLTIFEDFQSAETAYYSKFKQHSKSNFVLTHLDDPDFDNICIAYSSYVLTRHRYLNYWREISEKILWHRKEQRDKKGFKSFSQYIHDTIEGVLTYIKKEIEDIRSLSHSQENFLSKPKVQAWISELNEEIDNLNDFLTKIENHRKEFPRGGLFNWIKAQS